MFITFYNYIPEANNVPRAHSVAAVVYLQFVLHEMLFRTFSVFCTFTIVLSAVCVQCPIWLLFVVPSFHTFPVRCSSVVWMTLRCFHLPPLLLVPLCFRFPHALISIKRSLYLIIIIIIIVLKPLSWQSSINSLKTDSRVRWFNYTSVAEIEYLCILRFCAVFVVVLMAILPAH